MKQTAANNNFLKECKKIYNESSYKKILGIVNEGKQDVAEYAVITGLLWFVGGVDVAKKLMEADIPPKKQCSHEEIDELFEQSRKL